MKARERIVLKRQLMKIAEGIGIGLIALILSGFVESI